jgi:hypothetical protein
MRLSPMLLLFVVMVMAGCGPIPDFTVKSASPANNSVAAPLQPDIEITFKGVVDPSTLHDETVTLYAHQTGYRPFSLDVASDGRSATVTPDAAFLPGERVWLLVSAEVTDEDGLALQAVADGQLVHGGFAITFWTETPAAGAMVETSPSWESAREEHTIAARFADLDGDGWLDAVFANGETESYEPVTAHFNDGAGSLDVEHGWQSVDLGVNFGVDVGDLDGDGWLDVAAARRDSYNRVYMADGQGSLAGAAAWQSTTRGVSRTVAWGDADNDGDLDLAVANTYADGDEGHTVGYNELFNNDGGVLDESPAWTSSKDDFSRCVVWADIDGNGLLDLVFGNMWEGQDVYLNRGGWFPDEPDWSSEDDDKTRFIAVLDLDGDDRPDLAAANEDGYSKVYLNRKGTLREQASWVSTEYRKATTMAAGDLDGDGWPDLVFAHSWETPAEFDGQWNTKAFYFNDGGDFSDTPDLVSDVAHNTWGLDLGDVDGDGDLDLLAGERDQGVGGVANGIYLAR